MPLNFLSNRVANHEAQEARDCLCFDRVCLNLPAVRTPQVSDLHAQKYALKENNTVLFATVNHNHPALLTRIHSSLYRLLYCVSEATLPIMATSCRTEPQQRFSSPKAVHNCKNFPAARDSAFHDWMNDQQTYQICRRLQ